MNTTDNYSLQDLGLKCSAWKRLCLNYPKLMQIIKNLAEIEALPKCIRNKSSEIRHLFSAKIPPLIGIIIGISNCIGTRFSIGIKIVIASKCHGKFLDFWLTFLAKTHTQNRALL